MSEDVVLKRSILNAVENGDKNLSKEVAKLSGYSSWGNFKRILDEPKKKFDNFLGLAKVVERLFPDDFVDRIAEYSETIDINTKTARSLLEFLTLHNKHAALNKLINTILDSSKANKENKEYALIYNIDQKIRNEQMTPNEAILKFSKVNVTTVEMEVCVEIIKAYCFLERQEYSVAFQFVLPLGAKIEKINDKYLKDIYMGRYLLILAECQFRMNEIDEARAVCQKIFEDVQDSTLRSWTYLHYGNSYITENYDKAIDSFYKGLELTNGVKNNLNKQLKRSISFTKNFWKKDFTPDLDGNEIPDLHEIAFSEINKHNFEKATYILDSIDVNKANLNQKAFHFYLRGLISKNIDDFADSIYYFKQSNDTHFVKLPILELRKLGLSERQLRAYIA